MHNITDKDIEDLNIKNAHFSRIIGNSPMEQIDWVIRFGMRELYNWYERCMNGFDMYDSPIIIRAREPKIIHYNFEEEKVYARGGYGNSQLLSWGFSRELISVIAEHECQSCKIPSKIFIHNSCEQMIWNCPQCGADVNIRYIYNYVFIDNN